jgi:hypothetical protein
MRPASTRASVPRLEYKSQDPFPERTVQARSEPHNPKHNPSAFPFSIRPASVAGPPGQTINPFFSEWNMTRSAFAFTSILLACACGAQAQFSGPAVWSVPATTQLGTITSNTLTLTNTPNGFVVAGQLQILVPPAGATGTLAAWAVVRPLSNPFGPLLMNTTTVLDGFSTPPGAAGNTSGNVQTFNSDPAFAAVSQSLIPMTLTAGSATWTSLSNTSANFNYTSSGPGNNLTQRFQLDGIALTGGTWIVDVPVWSSMTLVPEPTVITTAAALSLTALRRQRRRV